MLAGYTRSVVGAFSPFSQRKNCENVLDWPPIPSHNCVKSGDSKKKFHSARLETSRQAVGLAPHDGPQELG